MTVTMPLLGLIAIVVAALVLGGAVAVRAWTRVALLADVPMPGADEQQWMEAADWIGTTVHDYRGYE